MNKGIKTLQTSSVGLPLDYLNKIRLANEGRYPELAAKNKNPRRSAKKGDVFYSSPDRKPFRKTKTDMVADQVSYLDPETAPILPEALNLSQTKATANVAASTLVQKSSLKNTIGGKTTAKKKSTFSYKETALNASNFKANNKFSTSSKFAYDENILDRTSKVIVAPVPFNLESGMPEGARSGSNAAQLSSQHKARPGGLKMQEKDFTIRKKKSRKEVEFLIGNRGVSET